MFSNHSRQFVATVASVIALGTACVVCPAEDTSDKAKETASSAKKGATKVVRKAKDETCEMVDGKMKCAAKKMQHKAQNAADDMSK